MDNKARRIAYLKLSLEKLKLTISPEIEKSLEDPVLCLEPVAVISRKEIIKELKRIDRILNMKKDSLTDNTLEESLKSMMEVREFLLELKFLVHSVSKVGAILQKYHDDLGELYDKIVRDLSEQNRNGLSDKDSLFKNTRSLVDEYQQLVQQPLLGLTEKCSEKCEKLHSELYLLHWELIFNFTH